MDSRRRILTDGAIAVLGNRILEVASTAEVRRRFTPRRRIDAGGAIARPGYIDGRGNSMERLGLSGSRIRDRSPYPASGGMHR